jgi:DNA excision repair protein ERCC-3
MSSAVVIQITHTGTVIVDSDHPHATAFIRAAQPYSRIDAYTGRFVRLHIDRTTLWSAAAQGMGADTICQALCDALQAPLDPVIERTITTLMARWGMLTLHGTVSQLELRSAPQLPARIHHWLTERLGPATTTGTYAVAELHRGPLKQQLVRLGWPVDDQAALCDGTHHAFGWRDTVQLRFYQHQAVAAALGAPTGIVVLPPGSGKTYIGVAVACALGRHTLILTPSRTAVHQWIQSVLHATDIAPSAVSGPRRGQALTPITVATYQQLIRADTPCHTADWGLIIYDEVHMLPAPVFRLTAALQARRRLGLSATLVREDGRIGDVFSLVGPQRYSLPWRTLESAGHIATAQCWEVIVEPSATERTAYQQAPLRQQGRLAAASGAKQRVVPRIAAKHAQLPLLVIGYYVDPLRELHKHTGWPLISGDTPLAERQALLDAFRGGQILRLILSNVGNQAIDVPNAAVLIQISGSFGSRQEEAQRLGRILRPKLNQTGVFYTVITRHTREVDDAWQRQQFLLSQGYTYQRLSEDDL